MNDTLHSPQTAVVIGGTSDIAAAIVEQLAVQRLRHVVLLARDAQRAEDVGKQLQASHPSLQVGFVQFDATDTASHEQVMQNAVAQVGEIDLVLVAVGVLGTPDGGAGPLGSRDEALAVINATFMAPVSMLHIASTVLHAQGHGTIAVISSVAALRPRRTNPTYGSSKAGLDGFTLALRDRLHGTGVRVMLIRPGFVSTQMTARLSGPQPPMSTTAQKVAADVVDGLRRGAFVVWSPRPAMGPGYAARFMPSWLLRRLPW